jgi:endonuclease I
VIPYTSTAIDTWDALKLLDEDPANPLDVILIYSGLAVPKSDQYTGPTGTWAREHLWPQSFGLVALNANSKARSDLFILRPIDNNVNSSRGNKYYDYSTAPVSTYPEAPGSTNDADSWEPRLDEQGPIARSLFYMAVRYDGSDAGVPDLELSDTPDSTQYRFGKLSTLLIWARQFAVTASERQRNQRIYSDYQHNRNPFIDHPEYTSMVFLGATPGQAWMFVNFTDAEINNQLISGDLADPDGDGLSNLLEYAFNGDPWQPDQALAPTVNVISQGANHTLVLSYSHNRNATDVTLTYESSTDLATWTPASYALLTAIVTSSETEEVTVNFFPTSAPAYFVRVRASRSSIGATHPGKQRTTRNLPRRNG